MKEPENRLRNGNCWPRLFSITALFDILPSARRRRLWENILTTKDDEVIATISSHCSKPGSTVADMRGPVCMERCLERQPVLP